MNPKLPSGLSDEITYRPDWDLPYQLWTELHHDQIVRKLLCDREIPMSAQIDVDSEGPRKVIVFGSPDPDDMLKIAAFFGKTPDAEALHGVVSPKVLGSRQADEGPRLKYPFHTLNNIGDYFLVKGGNRATIAVYASNYTKYMAPEKMITVRQVPEGILVLLLYSPNSEPMRSIVEP